MHSQYKLIIKHGHGRAVQEQNQNVEEKLLSKGVSPEVLSQVTQIHTKGKAVTNQSQQVNKVLQQDKKDREEVKKVFHHQRGTS